MASADVERVPDVMKDGHRSQQKEHRARRYSRKISEDSDPSPRISGPGLEQRRRSRPEGIRNMFQRRQLWRSSESVLLPPLRIGVCREPGCASPFHDAYETSFPASSLSLTTGGDHEPSNSELAPLADEQARSPRYSQRRYTQTMLSVAENDTPRLFSISSSDHTRRKVERRLLKSVSDAIHEVSGSPKSQADNSASQQSHPHMWALSQSNPQPKPRNKPPRHVSMQTLPKLSASEEPFSIRHKIEQFRKWHEEQYSEKLKKLKGSMEQEEKDATCQNPSPPLHAQETDFTKLLEDNMKSWEQGKKHRDKDDSSFSPEIDPDGMALHSEKDSDENQAHTSGKSDSRVEKQKETARCRSGATWRTWRDVNDSYAYEDVNKYIEDNELLPPERLEWISKWLGEVDNTLACHGEQDDAESLSQDLKGFP